MSQIPKPPFPEIQSRRPRSSSAQTRLDTAATWLASEPYIPQTCPVEHITQLVTTNTMIGKTILSKYDQTKLLNFYSEMRGLERRHMVEELHVDVVARQERDEKWRQVLEMAADMRAKWEKLEKYLEEALELTDELDHRLQWCERNFHPRTGVVGDSEQAREWGKGGEINIQDGKRM